MDYRNDESIARNERTSGHYLRMMMELGPRGAVLPADRTKGGLFLRLAVLPVVTGQEQVGHSSTERGKGIWRVAKL